MIVNFEFLSNEQIENVVTSLNYQVDKVICFGYPGCIEKRFQSTSSFLKKYCGVSQVECYALSEKDLGKTLATVKKIIDSELENGNSLFFDITGGESLSLVAFGMLADRYALPMHSFDIVNNTLIEHNPAIGKTLGSTAVARRVELTPEMYIELYGGVINKVLEIGYEDNPPPSKELNDACAVMLNNKTIWNPFLDFMRRNLLEEGGLHVEKDWDEIENILDSSGYTVFNRKHFNRILHELNERGLIKNLQNGNGKFSFDFSYKDAKKLLQDGGIILELKVLEERRKTGAKCLRGVHIDWDGVIHAQRGVDVLNEIDVLTVSGNIPTFISCKSGKMDNGQLLTALYELETVVNRFGGKYARKMLVKINNCSTVYSDRAKEMGIELITMRLKGDN